MSDLDLESKHDAIPTDLLFVPLNGKWTLWKGKVQELGYYMYIPLCHKLGIYQVKNFIRQAKKWRDDKWPEDEGGEGRPSSYLISLLVIKAFNIAQSTRYNS